MKLSEFEFELSDNFIAEFPADQRDESRLMVVHRDSGKIEHKMFKDVIDYFDDGDVMVVNDTKVFQLECMETEKTGAKIDLFIKRT